MQNTTKFFMLFCLILLVLAAAYLYLRPVPAIGPVTQIVTPPKTTAIDMPWPASGQAALGAEGYGVLQTNNATTPVPIASIAKIITAMAVLKQKPLTLNAAGPTITLDSTDLDFFDYYYSRDGSVVKVTAGETLSQYQALQAMLLPSANNIADSTARWAFGSTQNYVIYANQMLKNLGLTKTTVGDASGFGDTTTSTADELVKIGLLAMQQPVIAQIVGQTKATIPVAGEINNVNWLVGDGGVVGIKTGNTDKAGGCYLFAAKRQIAGKSIMLVGAVLGVPQLNDAISAAVPLLQASDNEFEQITVIHKGQVLGIYNTPWDKSAKLVAAKDISLVVWKGQAIKIVNQPDTITTPVTSGSQVGKISVQSSQQTSASALILSNELPKPSIRWRFLH